MEDFLKSWIHGKAFWVYVFKICLVIIFYLIFRFLSRLILNKVFFTVRHSKNKAVKSNPAISFIFSGIKVFLNILFFLIILPFFGVKTSSILAFIGALGLGLGLGLQDVAVDIFSGLKILLTKPFNVGDRIQYDSIEGNVRAMNIIHTIIGGEDTHTVIYIPNRLLTSNAITNFSQQSTKLLDIRFPLSAQTSIENLRRVLHPFLSKYLAPGKEDFIKIQIEALNRGYISIICSFWVLHRLNNKDVTAAVLEFLQTTAVDNKNVVLAPPIASDIER